MCVSVKPIKVSELFLFTSHSLLSKESMRSYLLLTLLVAPLILQQFGNVLADVRRDQTFEVSLRRNNVDTRIAKDQPQRLVELLQNYKVPYAHKIYPLLKTNRTI